MWQPFLVFILVVLAASPIAAEPTSSQPETTIRITSGQWEPWTSEDLPHHGVANRIVTEAFASQDIEVEYGFFPWQRAYELAKTDQWDASTIWIHSPERDKEFLFSDSVYEGHMVFFHRSADPVSWATLQDLSGKRVAVTRGYSYGPEFDRAVERGWLVTDPSPNDQAALRKLQAGRVDLVPLDEFVGLALLRKMYGKKKSDLTYNPKPVHRGTHHLIIRKSHPRAKSILKKLNTGLASARKLVNVHRYFMSNYPGPEPKQ